MPRDSEWADESVPCEKFAAGPPWMWATGKVGSYGWRNAIAVQHLIYQRRMWGYRNPQGNEHSCARP